MLWDRIIALMDRIIAWWKRPFQTSGSAVNWVLFVGLLIIAAWFWNVVLLMVIGRES